MVPLYLLSWAFDYPEPGAISFTINITKFIIVAILVMALTAIVSVAIYRASGHSDRLDPWLSGAVSGIYVVFFPVIFWILKINPAGYNLPGEPPFNSLFDLFFYTRPSFGPLPLLAVFLISFIMSLLIVAVTVKLYSENAPDSDTGMRKSPRNRKSIIAVSLLIVLVLLFFPIASMAGIMAGIIPHPTFISRQSGTSYSSSSPFMDYSFTNNGGPGAKYLDRNLPFIIYIDGKVASNQSAASSSGLNIKIYPEQGIGYEPGSSIKITGLKKGAKVQIIANFKDGVQAEVQG